MVLFSLILGWSLLRLLGRSDGSDRQATYNLHKKGDPARVCRPPLCKTRENSNFLKKGKIGISVKIRNFSRSRMMKRTFPLKSSHEIELPRRISLDSEVVGISRFSRRGVSDDT